jgi:hypothetical protein
VNGSTTVISVRASNFTYSNGTLAVVLLSSINSFGRMVTIFDEDGYVGGTAGRQILISTTRNVTFDSGQPVGGGAGDFRYFLTQKNQSLSVFPRTLRQWVLPQSVITSELANPNSGISINGTDFNALNAQMVSVSTNLEVYGSTISGTPFTINSRVLTSYTQDSLVVNGIQALTTSTGSVTVGAIVVSNIAAVQLIADNITNSDFIQASSFSTFVQTTSSLISRVITIADNSTGIPSALSMSSLNTLWNGSNIPYGTASTFSAGLLYYSTSLPVLGINSGLSSISSFIPTSVSSLIGGDTLSSYSTTYINLVQSLNYGPGVSSLSTVINFGLSSIAIAPSLSTLSTVISRGLSSVYVTPGISSLNALFRFSLSSVATNFGVSTLSTSISLGLSTVNATLAFSNVSTIYSRGVSDIANHTGISSLSTLIPGFFSSLILQDGISSLSSYIFSTVSSVVVGPGISSLSTTTANYYLGLQSPQGLSSLSTTLSGLSTQSVTLGLSSLSSFVSLGLSSVSIFGGLSTISTTVSRGLVNVAGGQGLSTLSTVINSVASSINTSQGASSLFLFIQNQFSSLNDQQGASSLSSFIGPALSSIGTGGGGSIQNPANLSTLIINTSTFKLWDSTNSVYRTLNISASKFYIDTTLIDTFVLQSTSRSTISISSFNLSIPQEMNASTVFGTSLYINPLIDFGFSTFASTVSTGLLTTSSFITSSINFAIGGRSLNLYLSNNGIFFNASTITLFSSLGSSSFSTSMSAFSSLSNIIPMPFSNISTALALGASTVNVGQGVSTLSTLLTQVSTIAMFPGISTNNFLASTALVSTISSSGQISTFIILGQLNTSTLITSSIFASNANIGVLNLPNILVSSFNFVNNTSITVSTLSTLVTGSGVSTGNVTIFGQTVSTFASNVITTNTYASSIVLSTLFIPNFGGSPNPAPLFVSTGAIWFNGNNLASSGDPNNLTALMYSFSTASVYTSSLIVSSLQTPTIVNASQKTTIFENVEITQSSLNLYNRTVFSTYNNPDDPSQPTYFDSIQFSTDGINWRATNWFQSSISGGFNSFLSKPSYNGYYWLVGNALNTNPNGTQGYVMNNYNNSIMYSPNGYQYYALENGQFDGVARQPQWNGQYWLAGDVYDTTIQRTIKRSVDGLIWTAANSGGFYGSCQNFGWNGSLWIAVGLGSNVTDANSNIQYSTDGLNWSNAQGDLPEVQANCVIFDGKKWIVGGQYYTSFVYSYDGINWTNGPVNDSNIVYDLAYNGKVYVAAGNLSNANCGLAYSYDGINWTYANAFLPSPYNSDFPLDGSAYSVTWSGDRFVATGSNLFTGLSGVYSLDGLRWFPVTDPSNDGTNVDMGQGIGFASNILPALETTTLRIHTMGKGYIPLYLTSTNHWQVTPSSIIMNNNFTINKELNSDRRIGIGTPYPLTTLDIAGTMQVNNSTFFSSIVIGSSFGYNRSTQTTGYVPTFDVSVIGSSFMTSLVINTPQNISRKGPLDVTSPNQPIINRGSYVNISSFGRSFPITSTLVNINQVATFPQAGRPTSEANDAVDNAFVYWLWNNGPATQQSSLYFAISGTASFFTGQHACFVSSVTHENVSSYVGLITASEDKGYTSVSLNGDVVTGSNAIYSTESIPNVALTSTDMQKGVFGIISDQQNLPAAVNFSTMYSAYNIQSGFKNALYGRLLINAVGDGALWVTNVNGNASIGDYLCSSVVPGHARVQDDPTGMYNYTVAKATMNCDFDLNSSNYRCETIDYNGSTFTRAFIGVTYHCG